ncbi:Reticulon [Macleaya cordata]|uniref:Reticulon-like protein n=1 Tax=Macleaya cordata TaxID=56857 RepID=A0A200PV15_MACCD|nr:Reticulon [Macleaya cordata]
METSDLDRSSAPERDSTSVSSSNCRKSVRQVLGVAAVADVLLWKQRSTSAILLVSSSIIWFFFEPAGYNLLLFITNALLLLVVILFFWAKSADLLNRPLPPLPNLEISDDSVGKLAREMQFWINCVLEVAREIILGGNAKLLIEVTISLWLVSYIGGLFNFITLVYIGVVLSLTVPALYDKYQDHFDDKLSVTHKVVTTQYRKFDENILSKIKKTPSKEKKIQ